MEEMAGWSSDPSMVKVETANGFHEEVTLEDLSPAGMDDMNGNECSICRKSFSARYKLVRHVKGVHDKIKDYKCDNCSYECSQKSSLNMHIMDVHMKDFKCDQCDYATGRKYYLSVHIRKHHSNETPKSRDNPNHKCDQCGKTFCNKQKLQYHVKCIHDKIRDYKCDFCNHASTSKYNLGVHVRGVHSNKENFKCDECTFQHPHKKKLKQHVRKEHPKHAGKNHDDDEEERSQASLPPVENSSRESIEAVVIKPVRETVKISQETPMQEKQSCRLSTKNKVPQYSCDQCEYKFSKKQYLERHKNSVHDKIKDFKCDKCSMAFALKGSLNMHIKVVHEKVKNFKCQLCQYTASNRSKLLHHHRIVHDKVKDFKCDRCDYATSKKCNLTYHIRAIHHRVNHKSKKSPIGRLAAKKSHELTSGSEIWVNKEPTTQRESQTENPDDSDDPLNINGIKIQPQSTKDNIIPHGGNTFTKEQIYKTLQINGNTAHWVRKKAAISIAYCGRLKLQDLTSIMFQSVNIVENGVDIKNMKNLKGSHYIHVPFNPIKSEPCPASLVIMYLNCLKRAPRALGAGDTLFSRARHEELCNLGKEVASMLDLDHPESYAGHCFGGENQVAEEDFMVDEPLMREDEFKVEPV